MLQVALELLLNSNEFILPLSAGDQHSLPIYIKNDVPVSSSQLAMGEGGQEVVQPGHAACLLVTWQIVPEV